MILPRTNATMVVQLGQDDEDVVNEVNRSISVSTRTFANIENTRSVLVPICLN